MRYTHASCRQWHCCTNECLSYSKLHILRTDLDLEIQGFNQTEKEIDGTSHSHIGLLYIGCMMATINSFLRVMAYALPSQKLKSIELRCIVPTERLDEDSFFSMNLMAYPNRSALNLSRSHRPKTLNEGFTEGFQDAYLGWLLCHRD